MDEQKPIYERMPDEPSQWYAKFLIYRNLKPVERSLLKAYTLYLNRDKKGSKSQYNYVAGAWLEKFHYWNWKERAEAYDAVRQAEEEARAKTLRDFEAAEKERILSSGLALVEKRIQALEEMSGLILKSMLKDPEAEDSEVAYAWVTPDKIREFRGCLDDIAKELGHRVKKQEIAGKVEVQRNPDLAHLTNEELETLAGLLDKASEREELAG